MVRDLTTNQKTMKPGEAVAINQPEKERWGVNNTEVRL